MRFFFFILVLSALPLHSAAADKPKRLSAEPDPTALFTALQDDLDRAATEQLARISQVQSNFGLSPQGSLSQEEIGRKGPVGSGAAEAEELPIPTNEAILTGVDLLREEGRGRLKRGQERLRVLGGAFERLFAAQHVPRELVWIAFVESVFQAEARSVKGAVGMWQLTAGTAVRYGLRVDRRTDERRDPIRSGLVAARYLRELHERFGDWLLALAAYNAGEDRVEQAIRRGRTRDFWSLRRKKLLPAETREFVPAVLAAIWAARLEGFTLSPPSVQVGSVPALQDATVSRVVSTIQREDIPAIVLGNRGEQF